MYLDYSAHCSVQRIDAPIGVGEFSHLYLLISFCYSYSFYCFPLYEWPVYCVNKDTFFFIIFSFVKQKSFFSLTDLWLCKQLREQYKCFVIFFPLLYFYAYLKLSRITISETFGHFFSSCFGIRSSFML